MVSLLSLFSFILLVLYLQSIIPLASFNKLNDMKSFVILLLFFFSTLYLSAQSSGKNREYYQLITYQFSTTAQEQSIDGYLEKALLPALHRKSIKQVGVFKPIANDTSVRKIIYVLIPSNKMETLVALSTQLLKDKDYLQAGKEYLDALNTNPPYQRMESTLMYAFTMAPKMILPKLTGPKADRVYELRSYESPTEKYYRNKVKMFNEGGEVVLFDRLQFNAIFYAEVISGSRMPNLVYMTSFENMDERNKHWKTFVDDPEWKKLVSMEEYKNNVSKAEIILTRAAAYSDY